MWKKLASLLLSLFVCLSLLPGQARAGDLPESPELSAVVEPVEPEDPGEPVMQMSESFPDEDASDHTA